MIEMMARGDKCIRGAVIEDAEALPGRGKDERKLADLSQGDGDRDGDPQRVLEQRTIPSAASGLPSRMTASVAATSPGTRSGTAG